MSEYHFLRRINRFKVETVEGKFCHLHDPGRLYELLIPGSALYGFSKNKGLECEIVYTKYGDEYILINSRYHSEIAGEIIAGGYLEKNFKIIRKEVPYGSNRFDFLLELNGKEYYMEVKGCTLLDGFVAKFPDAPTFRGREHLKKLIELRKLGFGAGLLFLIFRDAKFFMPNFSTDPYFYSAFKEAYLNGVEIFPFKLRFNGSEFFPAGMIDVKMDGPAGI